METKSLFDINTEVQKLVTAENSRPEQLTDQGKFNAFMLGKLNELSLQYSKGRRSFEVTEKNADILRAVFGYLNRSANDADFTYKGNVMDLNKGLLLIGSFGIGKTLLMRAIFENRNILKLNGHFTNAQQIFDHPQKTLETIVGKNRFGLWIDDIGEEPNVANDFGTHVTPVGNLIKARVDAWERLPESPKLFITSNCLPAVLTQIYGGRVMSRLYGACNVIISPQTEDFRKM